MRIGVRIFLGYFLVVGLTGWFLLDTARNALKPVLRQAMEDNLVDSANLLAEAVHDEVKAGAIGNGAFAADMERFRARHLNANIWGVHKDKADYRVYITDARGLVLYDSDGLAVGQDYSRWNDVYLTLHGQYGARASPDAETGGPVLHVAAPVVDAGKIVGVVTVAKPAASVEPFFLLAYRGLARAGIVALVASLVAGVVLSWWFTRSLQRLVQYAAAVGRGERGVVLPKLGGGEVGTLGRAMESMRTELEGKRYVEEYVHALTHELKSPLAAIRGAAELIEPGMAAADQARFLGNIQSESARLTAIIDRLLTLAQLEGRRSLGDTSRIMVDELVQEAIGSKLAQGLRFEQQIGADLTVEGDRFLLLQALSNLLDNAVAFSPEGGVIEVSARGDKAQIVLTVRDHGPGVPDYALGRVFERFYSLPRPSSGRKSTGLGLPFVREVATLHGGSIALANADTGGAIATLTLPATDFT
ncbi:MAG: two-component system sensor histidine kinase CreC [Burkholderiales bacterium]|nr:two-component system sensor histidine kinase CreC [Burkholderiales bacterium]